MPMPLFHLLPVHNANFYQEQLGLQGLQPSAIDFVREALSQPYLKNPYKELTARIKLEKEKWGVDLSLRAFQQSDYYKYSRQIFTDLPAKIFLDHVLSDNLDTHKVSTCERPNHGLAHTLRVAYYIQPIMVFFAKYARDQKSFVELNNQVALIQLQHLALFSVVGRLNEVGIAHLNKPLTSLYFRWRAGELFNHYMKQLDANGKPNYLSCGFTNEDVMNDCQRHLVSMGSDLNVEPMHVILNAAHRLDLMRCSDDLAHFNARFDTYIYIHAVKCGSLEELRTLAYNMLIATGDSSNTFDLSGEQPAALQYRQPHLDVANSSAAHCFELMYHVQLPRVNQSYDHYYAVRVAIPPITNTEGIDYSNNLMSDIDNIITVAGAPIENHPRRHTPKRPLTITLTNENKYAAVWRHEKDDLPPRYTKEQKRGFSPLMAVSLHDPGSRQPDFSSLWSDQPQWSYATRLEICVEKTQSEKHILFNHIYTDDANTVKRGLYDFDGQDENVTEALKYVNNLVYGTNTENPRLVTPDKLPQLLSAPRLQQTYNEALARLKCHHSTINVSIGICAPTIEACLIAKARAYHASCRLAEQASAEGKRLPANFKVKIYFRLPYSALDGKEYDEAMQEKHRIAVMEDLSNRKRRSEIYESQHVVFLLALDKPRDILNELLKSDDRINSFLCILIHSKKNMYVVEYLLQRLVETERFEVHRQTQKLLLLLHEAHGDELKKAYKHAAKQGFILVLQALGANYLNAHPIPGIYNNPAEFGRYRVIKWLINNKVKQEYSNNMFVSSPLHIAAQHGYVEICALFIQHHPASSNTFASVTSPLSMAADRGHLKAVRYLSFVNNKMYLKFAFIAACRSNHIRIMKYILSIYPNLPQDNMDLLRGLYPLSIAKGHDAMCLYLRSLGVSSRLTSLTELVDMFKRPFAELIKPYLDYLKQHHSLDILMQCNESSVTIIMSILKYYSIRFGYDEVVIKKSAIIMNNIYLFIHYLLDEKIINKNNIFVRSSGGDTLLHYLCEFNAMRAAVFRGQFPPLKLFDGTANPGKYYLEESTKLLSRLKNEVGADMELSNDEGVRPINYLEFSKGKRCFGDFSLSYSQENDGTVMVEKDEDSIEDGRRMRRRV